MFLLIWDDQDTFLLSVTKGGQMRPYEYPYPDSWKMALREKQLPPLDEGSEISTEQNGERLLHANPICENGLRLALG